MLSTLVHDEAIFAGTQWAILNATHITVYDCKGTFSSDSIFH